MTTTNPKSKSSMPDLLAASARMELAKRGWTRAAQAAIRGLPNATTLAIQALEELNAARAALALAQSITSLEERNVASAALAKASATGSVTSPNPTRRAAGASSPTNQR